MSQSACSRAGRRTSRETAQTSGATSATSTAFSIAIWNTKFIAASLDACLLVHALALRLRRGSRRGLNQIPKRLSLCFREALVLRQVRDDRGQRPAAQLVGQRPQTPADELVSICNRDECMDKQRPVAGDQPLFL